MMAPLSTGQSWDSNPDLWFQVETCQLNPCPFAYVTMYATLLMARPDICPSSSSPCQRRPIPSVSWTVILSASVFAVPADVVDMPHGIIQFAHRVKQDRPRGLRREVWGWDSAPSWSLSVFSVCNHITVPTATHCCRVHPVSSILTVIHETSQRIQMY